MLSCYIKAMLECVRMVGGGYPIIHVCSTNLSYINKDMFLPVMANNIRKDEHIITLANRLLQSWTRMSKHRHPLHFLVEIISSFCRYAESDGDETWKFAHICLWEKARV